MDRFRVVVCLCLGLLWGGCQSLFSTNNAQSGLSGSGPDGGTCVKDPQTIKNVMLAPPVCSATNPCPCGTYCSSQTGGNCVADCVDDTWCAPGRTCSPFGQCLSASAADGGMGGVSTTDPSCPKDDTLLASIKTNLRSCRFDDTCPFGSFCNHLTDVCDYQCLADTGCASMNTASHTFVCDCLGQCAAVGAPAVPPTVILPTMEVTPSRYSFALPNPITTPVWGGGGTRQITVDVVAQFTNTNGTTITGPTATIEADPGPGLMVQCPGGAFTAGPCSFSIDPKTFTAVNSVFKSAPITLTVEPSPGAPTATTWSLRLESTDVSNAPQSVVLAYTQVTATPAAPPNPVPISAPPPGYLGYGQVHLTTPLGSVITLPVLARTWNGNLVLFDDSRVLSPSGKTTLKVASGPSDFETFIDATPNGDQGLQGESLSGNIYDRMTACLPIMSDASSNTLSGSFSRSLYTDFVFSGTLNGTPTSPFEQVTNATYSLQAATSTSGFCSAASDCGAGDVCDLGFCSIPGPSYQSEGTFGLANVAVFAHSQMQGWGGYDAGASSPIGFVGLYLPTSDLVNDVSANPGYKLVPPLLSTSGEPPAELFLTPGVVLTTTPGPLAIPLLTQHDQTSPPPASQLLAECLAELARNPATASSPTLGETYDFSASCISLGRVSRVLQDETTFQRGLEGWLTVQSFIGREGLEETQMFDALGDTGIAAANNGTLPTVSPPNLIQLVGSLESGLGLVLAMADNGDNPYFFMSGPAIWNTIDYRTSAMALPCSSDLQCNNGNPNGGSMRCDTTVAPPVCRVPTLGEAPQYQQLLGVPYFALQAGSAYLNVLAAYLTQTAAQTFGAPADDSPASARQTALSHYGAGMRLVLFLEQWANAINLKAGIDTTQGTCPGKAADCTIIAQQFNSAFGELSALRGRVMNAAQSLHDNTNPFNIPEDDVPLFFGDPTGTNSQYFAASDYLLTGWALPAVTQAQAFLDAARSAWITQSQAAVQDELNQHSRQQEIDQLMSKYGTPILTNCGNLQVPNGSGGFKLLDDTQVIPYFADPTKKLSNQYCFIDATCGGGPQSFDQKAALQAELNAQFLDSSGAFISGRGTQTAADLFVASEACKATYLSWYVSSNDYVNQLGNTCPGDRLANPIGNTCPVQKGINGDNNLYFVNGAVHVPVAALFGPILFGEVGVGHFYPGATGDLAFGPSDNVYNYDELRASTESVSITKAVTTCVVGHCQTKNVPTTESLATVFSGDAAVACSQFLGGDYPRKAFSSVLPASCYKGSMGVAFHELQSDQLKLQDARSVIANGMLELTSTLSLCETEDQGVSDLTSIEAQFNQIQQDNQSAAQSNSTLDTIVNAGISLFTGGPVAALGTAVNDTVNELNTGLSNAIQDQFTVVQEMQANFAEQSTALQCWNNLIAQEGTLATAMSNMLIASNDVGTQLEVLQNMAQQNTLSIQEGVAVLQQEQASPVSSLGHQFWLDEKIEQFKKEFEWSRRLLYLGMRAVEYEFQESLPYRSQIVSAVTPAQLQDVVIGLQSEEASRTINRRRPDEASVVLSVRDDVLAIPDDSDAPTGERNWTPAQRFESRLQDERYAYRDSKGNYLGQAIPFTLAPKGILETRCGERLWTATATIQGDGIEASAPGASVLFLKRNTFSSQYCSGKAPTTDSSGTPISPPQMQIGVIHESADLFQPGSTVDLSDATEFTASLLYPWFNIPKTEFYSITYQNGSSQELAGRGLYGDYVLLFPEQVLNAGFALGNVEDVLLRLDYLSVDNLSQ